MKTIKAVQANADNFKEYGMVIAVPDAGLREASDQSEIQTFFGKLGIMLCEGSTEIGICVANKRDNVVTQLEQHVNTQELLLAIKGDFITPVATSIMVDGKLQPDLNKANAIRVSQGQGILFNEGIWHWTPFPTGETVTVLVVFKNNTPQQDFTCVDLTEPWIIT